MQEFPYLSANELHEKYNNGELSTNYGNKILKYQVLSPLFGDLFENKLVYHEQFTCIVKVEDMIITPELFNVIVVPHLLIRRAYNRNITIPEKWSFGASWEVTTLFHSALTGYSGWRIWTDPETVQKVEKLVLEGDVATALNLTLRHGW